MLKKYTVASKFKQQPNSGQQ